MAFFDKKEDVLDIELTPYGRHLLSQGKLKPVYYAFLDDDVIYDNRTALGKTERTTATKESNHLIKDRIISETPSLKPFTSFNSVETTINEGLLESQLQQIGIEDSEIDPNKRVNDYLQNYKPLSDVNSKFLQNTIGTSDHAKKNAPFWDVFMIRKGIDNSTVGIESTVSGAFEYTNDIDTPSLNQNIPQVNQTINYSISKKNVNNDPITTSIDIVQTDPVNDMYFKIKEEQIIARVLEKNAFVLNETFGIEVFLKNTNVGGSNNWKKLKFKEKQQRIQKDILLDSPDLIQMMQNSVIDEDTVEYFFNIFVDEEIDEEEICKGINELASEGLGTPDINVNCVDFYSSIQTNSEFKTPEECAEDCPPGYEDVTND